MSKKGFGKFVLGGAIGAGIALMFAPQEGSKTRKELKVKLDELIDKAKGIDTAEVKKNIIKKVEDIKTTVKDLDKEKALDIAKKEAKKLEKKAQDLYELAKEKGTPVVEKAVKEAKQATIKVAKEVVEKLENEEKGQTKKLTKKVTKK